VPWRGHAWTIGRSVEHRLRPVHAAVSEPWAAVVADPRLGAVRLVGLRAAANTPRVLIVVHGLGGGARSYYCERAARAAAVRGWGSLRLALRGAELDGEDVYHAGLTADLHAAVLAEVARGTRQLAIVGYSLGGHVALRAATDHLEGPLAAAWAHVVGVAAVCSPLDLAASGAAIDAPSRRLYRRHVLAGLHAHARAVLERHAPGSGPRATITATWPEIRGTTTIRGWDERVVAPRHGFASVDDYYARASVGPRLARLRVPALYVGSEADPMVPLAAVRASLARGGPRLDVRLTPKGGHVGFPATLELGLGASRGLEGQLFDAFERMG
jgi:predicted alpha/beta-fold hydrolase